MSAARRGENAEWKVPLYHLKCRSQATDPMFPLPRKIRSIQGPHCTCLMTSETYLKHFSHRGSAGLFENHFHKSIIYHQFRFSMYLMSGLVSMFCLAVLGILFLVGYGFTYLCLRFQYKVTLFLILLQRQPFELKVFNDVIIFLLHICLILIGGFGYISVLFIEL